MDAHGRWLTARNGAVSLAVRSFGGSGEPVVLLHGLAGHAGEWGPVAEHLTSSHRVFALDLRGHGRSDRHPQDVSPDAFFGDVLAVVGALELGPAHLAGQSFGGHVGFLAAAHSPGTVSSLTVIEADPDASTAAVVQSVAGWLASWSRPFPTEEDALAFFATSSSPETWVAGLEEREGGYWPAFDAALLTTAFEGVAGRSWWDESRRVVAPTVVIRGDRGELAAPLAQSMASLLAHAETRTVADAGHDVHLDQPGAVAEAIKHVAAAR